MPELILTKINTRFSPFFSGHFECVDRFSIWSGMRMRKATAKVPSANRLRHARTRSQDAASLGASLHTFEQSSYVVGKTDGHTCFHVW